MPSFPHGEPVTVYTSTTASDRYGNDVSTWAVGETYERCVVSARRSDDLTDGGRQGVIVGLNLFMPADAVVGNHDRLEVRGEMYEVVGEPFLPHSPFTGLEPGLTVAVQRVAG